MPASISTIEFFSALQVAGQAGVTREALEVSDSAQTGALLLRAFHDACDDMPGGMKVEMEWHPEAAVNALHYLYRLCQALVDRAMPDEQVGGMCAAMPMAPSSPGEALSLDVALRHLPELHAMARSMSGSDPLVAGIEQAAKRFPLSSVGIALKEPPDFMPLRRHAGLWQLYIDRIIERQDASRLNDPHTSLAVADALGEHAFSLAPKLAARLALDATAPSILISDS